MFSTFGTRVSSIRVTPEAAEPRLSAKALWLTRVALAAGATGLVLAWLCATSRWTSTANDRVGVQVACPRDWSVRAVTAFGIEVADGAHETGIGSSCVGLERYRWYEFEIMRHAIATHVPDPRWREDEDALIGETCLWLRIVPAHTRAARLGDARATMVTGPRPGGRGAAVIAREPEGFVVLHLYAPTERDLRRVWPLWQRMMRTAVISAPAPPPQPDWGPPDHL
jgi:hypothetical protein